MGFICEVLAQHHPCYTRVEVEIIRKQMTDDLHGCLGTSRNYFSLILLRGFQLLCDHIGQRQ